MKRILPYTLLLAGMIGATALAYAATFQADPVVTDDGTTLRVQGTVSGLANRDVVVRVRATGTAEVTCTNPAGEEPPGQNRTGSRSIRVAGSQTIPVSSLNGGVASLDVSTLEPKLTPKAAGCPSSRWSASVNDVRFQSVTIRVLQGGELVLQRTIRL